MVLMLVCACCGQHFEATVEQWRTVTREHCGAYCLRCEQAVAAGDDPLRCR